MRFLGDEVPSPGTKVLLQRFLGDAVPSLGAKVPR